MKITNQNDRSRASWDEIKIGEIFTWNNKYYLKLLTQQSISGNAYDLNNNQMAIFGPGDGPIFKICDAELIIK